MAAYTLKEVKRVQARLLEMAVCVRDILDAHGIPYFLCAGTLLGAIRHKGFIPWDDDFDMYIFEDSYKQAMFFLSKELPDDMFLENEITEPQYFHAWAHVKDCNTICHCEQFPQDSLYEHKGISIDLYKYKSMKQKEWPLFKYNEGIIYLNRRLQCGFISKQEYDQRKMIFEKQISEREKQVQEPEAKIFCSVNSKYMMDRNCILPLSKVLFEGYEFSAPHDSNQFLTKVYKNYMELPSEDQRKPHYSKVVFNS